MLKDEDYAFLKKTGIYTVVNLQYPFVLFKDYPVLCSKYHLNCAYLPVEIIPRSDLVFDIAALKNAYKFTLDELKAGKEVYLHCYYGQERTGILAAALMIRERMCKPGVENDPKIRANTWKALDEAFRKYGYREAHQKPFMEMKTWVTGFESNKNWICQ